MALTKLRWWERWGVATYQQLSDGFEIAHTPKYFFWHINALRHQRKIHREHTPGTVRTICSKRMRVRWWWRWSGSASKRGMWEGQQHVNSIIKGFKEGSDQ